MALFKETPPGVNFGPKHSRGVYKAWPQGRCVIRSFARVHRPKNPTPPGSQYARWHDWLVNVKRKYQGCMAHDWNIGNIPHDQAWWKALADAVPITNYKGDLITTNSLGWFIWYTNQANMTVGLFSVPCHPDWLYPYWEPALPWNPPATEDAQVISSSSTSSIDVHILHPLGLDWNTPLVWLARNPRTQGTGQPSHFLECPVWSGQQFPAYYRVQIDMSNLWPTIPPGTRMALGWAMFRRTQYDPGSGVWIDIYQPTPRRWMEFTWG